MSRLKLILAIIFFTAIALPLHTQVAYPNGLRNPMPEAPSDLPQPKAWKAAINPDPRFPLRVKLTFDQGRNRNKYNGLSYYGRGIAEVIAPQATNLNFTYDCDLSLGHLGELQARWITPGRKLEVLLQNAGATRTRTCRISVSS
jgi:hypothetical protein